MELVFNNNIDGGNEVVEENLINVVLFLNDFQYQEMIERSDFTKETGLIFEDVANSDDYFTAYLDIEKDTCEFYRLQIEYNFVYYDIPLTEKEQESIVNDFRNEILKHYNSYEEYIKEFE